MVVLMITSGQLDLRLARNSHKKGYFQSSGMPALKAEEYKFTFNHQKIDSFITNYLRQQPLQ